MTIWDEISSPDFTVSFIRLTFAGRNLFIPEFAGFMIQFKVERSFTLFKSKCKCDHGVFTKPQPCICRQISNSERWSLTGLSRDPSDDETFLWKEQKWFTLLQFKTRKKKKICYSSWLNVLSYFPPLEKRVEGRGGGRGDEGRGVPVFGGPRY